MYTHLKQKHEGVTPSGTLTPITHQCSKMQLKVAFNSKEEHSPFQDSFSEESNQLQRSECMEELWALLFIIQNKLKIAGVKIVLIQQILACEVIVKIQVDAFRQFPCQFFNNQADFLPVLNEIKKVQELQTRKKGSSVKKSAT